MQVFPIPPAGGRGIIWFFIIIIVVLMGVTLMLGWAAWSTRNSRAEVSPEGLKLVGDLWGRTIPLDQLQLDDARVVDLRGEPDLVPRRRTMGTALGGYSAGWFRLRNGEKTLVYLTDRRRVVYIPTRDGYSLLLSQSAPGRFLDALRNATRGG
ncbi:PH domain-containing protein [Candidatus Palauibacter sp.]|uniref:PH domain-containing protein n=1 Tax=Candidatus Palauibacter sp. TaxID=3101350 RepID=UPI003AF200C8